MGRVKTKIVIIGNLGNLTTLYLFDNQLSGSIPQEIGMLSRNKFTGSILASIENLGNLTTLYFFDNELFESISQEVGMLRSLVDLELSMNNLTDSIPASIRNLSKLAILSLYNNMLNGHIPEGLCFNGFEVSQKWGKSNSLTSLKMSNNNISGEIPPEIMDSTQLRLLDLSSNDLVGQIPGPLGTLLLDVLDQRLPAPENQVAEQIVVVAKLAFACLHANPPSRPTMRQVTMKLSDDRSISNLLTLFLAKWYCAMQATNALSLFESLLR
ncbi:hypothetical protein ACSBR1_030392 [Camellia fascicularis]